jgi:hypothetical protein
MALPEWQEKKFARVEMEGIPASDECFIEATDDGGFGWLVVSTRENGSHLCVIQMQGEGATKEAAQAAAETAYKKARAASAVLAEVSN